MASGARGMPIANGSAGSATTSLRKPHPMPHIGPKGPTPKAQAPKPPFHPFCRCVLTPRWDLEGDGKPKHDAERRFFEALPAGEARKVAGSADRLRRILADEDWEKVVNGNADPLYRLQRVRDVYRVGTGVTLPTVTNAYETAKRGGKHSGMLRQLDRLGSRQLEKAIRSHQATIDIHRQKISNPRSIVEDWDARSAEYQSGLLKKWQAEIDNLTEQILVIEGYINERRK